MSSSNAKTLSIFMPAMILYPNAQAKAQFELDIVLGKGVLPPSRTWMKVPLFGDGGEKMVEMKFCCTNWHPPLVD